MGNQVCDFNNDIGVKVGEAIKVITASDAFLTGDDTVLQGGMGDTIAAGVSGTWNAQTMMDALGDNYAACKLPTFTCDGKQVQMSSFSGHKLMGVNSMTAFPEEAMALAEFLTSEGSQLERYNASGYGPSNVNVAGSDEVKSNIALSALANQANFATAQNNVSDQYWGAAEAFGDALEKKDYSKSIKEQLDAMVEQMKAAVVE